MADQRGLHRAWCGGQVRDHPAPAGTSQDGAASGSNPAETRISAAVPADSRTRHAAREFGGIDMPIQ
jgi:hypothetical protein